MAKKNIHPKLKKAKVTLSDGSSIEILSSLNEENIKLELDSRNNSIYLSLRSTGDFVAAYVNKAKKQFIERFGQNYADALKD